MKIRLFSIATIMALLLTLMPLNIIAASVNVTLTDIPTKKPGDTVTISGTTSLNEVIIKTIRPDTTILYYDVAVPINGGYTTSFKLPVDADLGNYTVVAGKGADVITDEFAVTTAAVVRTNANLKALQLSEEASIDFSADKQEYTTSVGNSVTSITVSATADDAEATITINSEETSTKQINLIEGSNTVLVEVTAQDGTTQKTYSLIIKKPALQIVVPNVPIQVSTEPLSISVPAGSTNATMQVTTVTIGTTKHATLPQIEVNVVTSLGIVRVSIPAGTQITAPSSWDNIIKLPEVKSNSSLSVAGGEVSAVIEVGSPDVTLIFDKAVRLLIPNQAGKAVGYIKGNVFTPITEIISADTQDAADRELVAGGEGKIDVDSDQVIWTKHFTKFASYTPAPTTPKSSYGSSSGGGSPVINTDIILSNGGTVNQNGAVIVIPVGAITSDIRVTVEKVTNMATLPTATLLKLVSDVYEIKKDEFGEFSKSVSITLPFDKTAIDLDKTPVAIYWLNEQTNQWVQLDNTQVDKANSKVSGSVNHFTKFAVLATVKIEASAPGSVDFSDVKGHWAEKSIQDLIQLGAIKGYPDGTFKPATNITRAEFISVIVKAFNLPPKDGKVFADTDNHWAQNSISTAAMHGIISGYSDTTFGPDDLITREQMAVLIVGVNKMEWVADGKAYADSSDVSDWAKAAIAITTSKGLLDGFEDGTLKPKGKTTRAEAATVILRALSLKQ
ncbi:S-layer homology domain-containing protein [Paenibacillus agricola]|uniref:SLH domain-containing protein n=1 Tax=Paenibacillus agricola TaxID=2716264 RepID=A0ABX0J4T5_9BACL|nr:S-layer homology domain-containing protein [Paenibacillus agricola]NHN30154.1 hypothetical protein [Paenibacillus agricola]